MPEMVMVKKVALDTFIEEIRGLRAEVRSLLTEKDPRLKDAREIFIAASHGDKKATKQFSEIASKMKAEGKTAAEILEQVAG